MKVAIALFIVVFATGALAHDDLDWITSSKLKNVANEWCCGRGDCVVVEKIVEARGGWLLPTFNNEFVPFSEAIPASQNGKFIRCHRPDGSRRCFISPPSGS